jgi:hypothetical protein
VRIKLGVAALLLTAICLCREGAAYGSWAFPFVVYDGNLYVVTEEPAAADRIGKRIGQVTKYSDLEGTYSGNFSNRYPEGTKYYEIKGTSVREAIAVQVGNKQFVKAAYQGEYAGGREKAAGLSAGGERGASRQRAAWLPYVLLAPVLVFIAGYWIAGSKRAGAGK